MVSGISIPLIAGTAGGDNNFNAPQTLYNMYPIGSTYSKAGVTWKNTPGYSEWLDLSDSNEIRASIIFQDNLYIIQGAKLKKITPAKSISTIVSDISTSGDVSMAENGFSICIADGVKLRDYNGTDVEEPDLPVGNGTIQALTAPQSVIFHDGYFLARQIDSGVFYISNAFDGRVWQDLQFAVAEDKPDNIVELASDRLLWLFGAYTTQAYYNDGDTFPFKPNPQGNIIYGMAGLRTHAQLDNTLYWLARSRHGGYKVVRANGYQPEAVSTPEIEEEINSFADISDAYAMTVMWEGHEWYVLTFPTEDRTFVYTTQQMWFEWGDWDGISDTLNRHPMTSHIFFDSQNLFTTADGKIMKLDGSLYTHNGSAMLSQGVSNIQHVDEQRMFLRSLIYDMRVGDSGEGDILTAISYDSGYNYSSYITRSLGTSGDRNHRVQLHRLGSGFNVTIKWRITDNVKREISRAILDVDVFISYLERRNERAGLDSGQ